ARDLGLEVAFRPYFRLHRDERQVGLAPEVVAPGDVIHCDVGISYLRLISDHQHVAYVTRRGESGPPDGLVTRMEETNRLQDIFLAGFAHGRSGNEMLEAMLREARAADIAEPQIYSHNIGLFLHQPGPLIGLPWEQEPVLPRGNVRLEHDSAFVMELSTTGPVPEWGDQRHTLSLEEPVLFTGGTCQTVCERQTAWHVL
ncbi:MAG TPA: M24 family metallopeptidase, partial [Thermomicrobiales bacterium]|nr:M24 family metallopeptidase [Thermomicrobiales bacterium]